MNFIQKETKFNFQSLIIIKDFLSELPCVQLIGGVKYIKGQKDRQRQTDKDSLNLSWERLFSFNLLQVSRFWTWTGTRFFMEKGKTMNLMSNEDLENRLQECETTAASRQHHRRPGTTLVFVFFCSSSALETFCRIFIVWRKNCVTYRLFLWVLLLLISQTVNRPAAGDKRPEDNSS